MSDDADMATPVQDVRRRYVFYVHGFDPSGARKYREMYRAECKVQGEISGYSVVLKGTDGAAGHYRWATTAKIDGTTTETTFEVLDWSDLVRISMSRSTLHAVWTFISTLWFGFFSGAVTSWRRARPVITLATLYPYFALCLQLVVGVLLGIGLAGLVRIQFGLSDSVYLALVAGFSFLNIAIILKIMRRMELKTMIYYLLFIGDFAIQRAQKKPPEYCDREQKFADRIADVLASEDVDEVLIVGHSAGTCLVIPVVADVLRRSGLPHDKLSLLTLGQVIQYVSFLPGAGYMRRDLRQLSVSTALSWVDVSAPSDGACFALTDPVTQSGVAPDAGQQVNPIVLSGAFTLSLSEEWRKQSRFSYFHRHFQYLCAFDRPRDYDYFQITAGPLSLGKRYAARGSSASVRRDPVSFYTDLAADNV